MVGKNENGRYGRSDTADSVRSIRLQFVHSGYLYLWLRSKELGTATRRNVPNLLRNLLYIFLIFPSYYSLLLFVMLSSIITLINSQVLFNTERSSCWWFHALIQSIIFATSEFRRRRIKSGAKWFYKDLLEKWSAMNFMIYSCCSWQRGPTKKKKGDKGYIVVYGYKDPELAIIADCMNYDCVHASDV